MLLNSINCELILSEYQGYLQSFNFSYLTLILRYDSNIFCNSPALLHNHLALTKALF